MPDRSKLIYYLILWMTVALVYMATVFLYLELPAGVALIEGLIFALPLLFIGMPLFIAIGFMDMGIKNLTEKVIANVLTAGAGVFVVTYLAKTIHLKINFPIDNQETLEQVQSLQVTGALFMHLLLALVYYLLKYQESIDEKKRTEMELKRLLQEAELNLLKSQLNPHFIFNSLNSISSLTITNPALAREMVIKLSEFLRLSLSKNNNEPVSLDEEIGNTMLFVDIEKVRFGNRLNVVYEVQNHVKNCKVPNMVLQPLMENAIKYSMYDTLDDVNIKLIACQKNEHIIIRLENPYDPSENSSKGKGIGIQNVKSRLYLLYGSQAGLNIKKNDSKFSIEIIIPS